MVPNKLVQSRNKRIFFNSAVIHWESEHFFCLSSLLGTSGVAREGHAVANGPKIIQLGWREDHLLWDNKAWKLSEQAFDEMETAGGSPLVEEISAPHSWLWAQVGLSCLRPGVNPRAPWRPLGAMAMPLGQGQISWSGFYSGRREGGNNLAWAWWSALDP